MVMVVVVDVFKVEGNFRSDNWVFAFIATALEPEKKKTRLT